MRNVLMFRGTMLVGKSSMRIGVNVKPLEYYCSCLRVSILLPVKKLLFWKKMLCSGNLILCRLAKCCDASISALAAKFHIDDVVRSNVARIKDSFCFHFSKLLYSVLCLFVSFCVFYRVRFIAYFFVHAAIVRIKLMRMMIWQNASLEDDNVYTCIATNTLGNISSSTRLIVRRV